MIQEFRKLFETMQEDAASSHHLSDKYWDEIVKILGKSIKNTVTEHWEKELLENLFGGEELFLLANETFDDPKLDKEYELEVVVYRGKEKQK